MKKINEFEIDPFNVTFEPLAGSTFINILRLLSQNKFKIDSIGYPRILYSIAMSLIMSPMRIYEYIKFNKIINETTIDKQPIFVLGHWRTGTTYLHNLISQDTQFGFPTTYQTVTPSLFLSFENFIKPIVISSLPEKRPQDDVDLGADLPNEEEYALGSISPYSFYNGWIFPKNMDFYSRYVDLNNLSKNIIDDFKKVYLKYIKKLTYYYNGKQIVLKNPSNTSRIKFLLDIFPEAKFISIIRNPYHVYLSMKRNIEKEMILYTIQNPPEWNIFEKSMVNMYNRMFKKYFNDINFIKTENFIELKYEEFLLNPLFEMERIYNKLNLNGFDKNKEIFNKYIKSQTKIKTQKYKIDKKTKDKIYSFFKFTIDKWDYNIDLE
jgi:hypothetical protein